MRPVPEKEAMTRRPQPMMLLGLFAALALPSAAWAAAPAAEEESPEEKSAPAALEEKMPAVSGRLFLKNGRFEISPTLSASLADAFFQKYAVGLKLDYHLVESVSVGLHASYSLNTPSGVVTVCKPDGSCGAPELADLTDVPGKIGLLAGAEVAWAPIYGKFSLFAERIFHFDLAFLVGASAIQYQAPGGTDKMTVGAHFGIGQRYFITPDLTLRLELRDYVYSAETVTLGNSSSKLENQIMFELGLSFFAGSGSED